MGRFIMTLWLGVIITLIILEIALRLTIGFGNPLLYISDPAIGYLLAPNQKVRRFGNRVEINEYSLRSPKLVEPKQDLRVLLLGDSVLNGSWWTDQKDTISEMIRRNLQPSWLLDSSPSNLTLFNSPSPEILNASANGWSPRNELAYLQKFGIFQADILILVLNTDDLFGTAPTSVPVGRDRYYPSHAYPLALIEAATRLFPYAPPPEMELVKAEGGDRVGFNLAALGAIHHLTGTEDIPLILTLTPLWHEVLNQTKEYEILARERLVKFTQDIGITYLDFLPLFQDYPEPRSLYRDQIHLTPQGNNLVSAEISKLIVGETRHGNLEDKF